MREVMILSKNALTVLIDCVTRGYNVAAFANILLIVPYEVYSKLSIIPDDTCRGNYYVLCEYTRIAQTLRNLFEWGGDYVDDWRFVKFVKHRSGLKFMFLKERCRIFDIKKFCRTNWEEIELAVLEMDGDDGLVMTTNMKPNIKYIRKIECYADEERFRVYPYLFT